MKYKYKAYKTIKNNKQFHSPPVMQLLIHNQDKSCFRRFLNILNEDKLRNVTGRLFQKRGPEIKNDLEANEVRKRGI